MNILKPNKLAVLLFILFNSIIYPANTLEELPIHVEQIRAIQTPPGVKNGVIYMNIINNSSDPDRLIKIQADSIAYSAELHQLKRNGDMFVMQEITFLDIPGHTTIVLQPAGTHVMLINLKQPLKLGQEFKIQLYFEKSGTIEVCVPILPE